ncbi:hypothetical protein E2P64_01685, partial [Candidatus Bathyarchaeota archaeon]
MPKTIEEAEKLEIEAERKGADFIEIRLDLISLDINLEDVRTH